MTHYQYPQQPWTERAQAGTRAVQSTKPTSVSQPAQETQATGRFAQQPAFAGQTTEFETQPTRQEAGQYAGQPTHQAGTFSSPQIEPQQTQRFAQARAQPQQVAASTPQQLAQPVASQQIEPRQLEAPSARRLAQPVAQPQVQQRQVKAPSAQRLAQPVVGSQQLPARTEWAGQQLPARPERQELLSAETGIQQPMGQFAQTVPAQQAGGMQVAGGRAPSGVQAASGGQAAAQAQPTGGEQAMAAQPEAQGEQQSQVKSLTKGMPAVDIYETPDELVIFADVPGCTPEDVELLGNESSLTLVANRGEPSITNGKSIQRECAEELERTIPLPARADVEEAEATVEDGVVRTTLPKSEDDREKRIGIQ